MKKIKTIALFGGSFNPPHAGHYEMARLVARRKGIDEVWILPVFRHPFNKEMEPFGRRLRWCRSFFKRLKKVRVRDLERRLGGRGYTIQLIRTLKERHPSYRFNLVMGADAWRDRRRWREFGEIMKQVKPIVFPRGPRSPIPNISSTELRKNSNYSGPQE